MIAGNCFGEKSKAVKTNTLSDKMLEKNINYFSNIARIISCGGHFVRKYWGVQIRLPTYDHLCTVAGNLGSLKFSALNFM